MKRLATLASVFILAISACGGSDSSGPEWTAIQTSTHWWMSAVVTDDSGWVVGGTTDTGSILRLEPDGPVEIPHGGEVGLLNWVHRFESGELIVVGNSGAVLRSSDGVTWSQDDPPTDQDLWGVWGSAPNDVWAVGGTVDGGRATILRDTGSGFTEIPLPDLERPGVEVLFKVWGSGPSDVWIVGQRGVVLHWDGSALEELLIGIGDDLIGVWGTGPDRVAVVGGRRNAEAGVWDGTEWRTLDIGRHGGLNGVWMDESEIYVVGLDGLTGTIDFDAATASFEQLDTPIALHAVAGSRDRLVAVGGDFGTGPDGPFLGQVWEADRP